MRKKGALQISFPWLFAIIVGAFIIFLAIFASVKLIKTGETQNDAEIAKQIGILLNPLETGFEESRTASFSLPSDTRIINDCEIDGFFGRQIIRVSQKSFGEWTNTDVNVAFQNKYIFSNSIVEGKNFILFSKPLEFPYKVSDLIYLIPEDKEYCFVDTGADLKREISSLNKANLLDECSPNDESNRVDVCFSSNSLAQEKCEIVVNRNLRQIEKLEGNDVKEFVFFEDDALMFAAIFSDKKVYECQTKRLMMRTSELADLYLGKSDFVAGRDCNSENIRGDLTSLKNSASNYVSSENLFSVNNIVEDLDEKNKQALCKLW